jgi:hypothetical protein
MTVPKLDPGIVMTNLGVERQSRRPPTAIAMLAVKVEPLRGR